MANCKYDEYVKPRLFEIENWFREGLIEDEIAERLGISRTSFYQYKKDHKELRDALITGKAVADYQVENSLFKRAIGYTYEEVTKERVVNPNTGKAKLVETKRVTKEVQPDPTSMIFWLKNRKSSHWRDKQNLEIEGSLDVDNKYSYMSSDEIEKEAKRIEGLLNGKQK